MTGGGLIAWAFRMTARDLRTGEVIQLALGVAIAVASLASVGLFVDRAQRSLQREAAAFLGADLVLQSDRPIDDSFRSQAVMIGLRSAQTVTFPSMVAGVDDPDRPLLVSVKAVSADYPLRGTLRLLQGQTSTAVDRAPDPGTAWIDPRIRDTLALPLDRQVRLGDSSFSVGGLIMAEPDRGAVWTSFAPRIMIRLDDLAATGLVQPASRVSYHLMVAGSAVAVDRFADWIRPRLAAGQRLQSLKEGRPDLQTALERARQFLTLVALLAAMLSAAAIASAARRFAERRIDTCGVLRCLGMPGRQIFGLYLMELAMIGALGCVAGALVGFAFQHALVLMLAGLLPPDLPAPSAAAALRAMACGLVLLAGFGLVPLARLRNVAPLRVLRREAVAVADAPSLAIVLAAAAAFLLLLSLIGDLRLAMMTVAAFGAAAAVFAGTAWLGLRALAAVRARSAGLPVLLGLSLAAIARRPLAVVSQVTALALGLCALLVMAFVQRELVRQWQAQIPADAPDRFIINIQPDQAIAVAQRLRGLGVADVHLYPMIRGRLVSVNGQPMQTTHLDGERARALVEREFNLSYASQAPEHNRIVEGHWLTPVSDELSIEEGIARTLGVRLGDRLCFDVAGQSVCAVASSMRRLSWDSMKVNFFIITSPHLLQDQPQTYITSIFVSGEAADPTARLTREFRNLTVIDTTQIVSQIRTLIGRISNAVQFIVLFAVGAGVLVLYTTVSNSQDERMREAALLRALGASRRRLWTLQFVELTVIGACAGALAGAGANAIGWFLARQVLEFDFRPDLASFAAGVGAGILCAVVGGAWTLERVVATPPMRALRDA